MFGFESDRGGFDGTNVSLWIFRYFSNNALNADAASASVSLACCTEFPRQLLKQKDESACQYTDQDSVCILQWAVQQNHSDVVEHIKLQHRTIWLVTNNNAILAWKHLVPSF